MTREIRVGTIGYGFMGRTHAWCHRVMPFHYDPLPAEVRLVAVATAHRESAERAKAQGGFECALADWRELVARPDVDVVDVCSPNSLHAEQVLAAIAAGKHVYCDKPLAATAAEADAVERALGGWRGIGRVTFQNRFFAATMRARQLVEEGFLGTVLGFRGVYLHCGGVDPEKPIGWRQQAGEGAGALGDLGSHLLDLAEWLVGPFDAIRAERRVLYPRRPDRSGRPVEVAADDQVVMTVRLAPGGRSAAGGALGTLEASRIATGVEDRLRLEIHGDRGALAWDLEASDVLEVYAAGDPDAPLGGMRGWKRIAAHQRYGPAAVFPPPRSTAGWLRGHLHSMYCFLDSVASGRQDEPSLARGVQVQRMIDAAERSAASGGWVTLGRDG